MKDIIKSFKNKPFWTAYALILSPLYYTLIIMAAIILCIINLSLEDAESFWDENS